jgi:hypothetical protein
LLFIDIKIVCDSVRGEVMYKIVTVFGIRMELVGLIKTCINKIYSEINIGKNLFAFPIHIDVKQDALLTLLFNSASEYVIRKDWN